MTKKHILIQKSIKTCKTWVQIEKITKNKNYKIWWGCDDGSAGEGFAVKRGVRSSDSQQAQWRTSVKFSAEEWGWD